MTPGGRHRSLRYGMGCSGCARYIYRRSVLKPWLKRLGSGRVVVVEYFCRLGFSSALDV